MLLTTASVFQHQACSLSVATQPLMRTDATSLPTPSSRIAICSWTLRPENPHHLLERLQQLHISAVQISLSQIVDGPDEWGDAINVLRQGGIWTSSGMMALAGEDYRRLDFAPRFGGLLTDFTWFANRAHAERVARL